MKIIHIQIKPPYGNGNRIKEKNSRPLGANLCELFPLSEVPFTAINAIDYTCIIMGHARGQIWCNGF